MAGDELVRRLGVLMLAPAFGEHVFLLRIEQGKFANFGEITRKAAFADNWKRPCRHDSNPLSQTTARTCSCTSYQGANAFWMKRIPYSGRIWVSGAPIARRPKRHSCGVSERKTLTRSAKSAGQGDSKRSFACRVG